LLEGLPDEDSKGRSRCHFCHFSRAIFVNSAREQTIRQTFLQITLVWVQKSPTYAFDDFLFRRAPRILCVRRSFYS
jgi:hypothetical protein